MPDCRPRAVSTECAAPASDVGSNARPASVQSAPITATDTAADVPKPLAGGTNDRTSTLTPPVGRPTETAMARNGSALARGSPSSTTVSSPPSETMIWARPGPQSNGSTVTSTPGPTATLVTMPRPANHVSVHPPTSAVRTGACTHTGPISAMSEARPITRVSPRNRPARVTCV